MKLFLRCSYTDNMLNITVEIFAYYLVRNLINSEFNLNVYAKIRNAFRFSSISEPNVFLFAYIKVTLTIRYCMTGLMNKSHRL